MVTQNRQKFQVLAMLENGTETSAMLDNVFALDYNNRTPIVKWFKLWVLLQEETNLPIQYVEGIFTWIDLTVENFSGYIAIVSDTISKIGTGVALAPIVKEEIVVESIINDICATKNYTNATFVAGNVSIENTARQNNDSNAACYFSCNPGYIRSGRDCIDSSKQIVYNDVNLWMGYGNCDTITSWLSSGVDVTTEEWRKSLAAKFCSYKWNVFIPSTTEYTCINMRWIANQNNWEASTYFSSTENTSGIKYFNSGADDQDFSIKTSSWWTYYPTMNTITCIDDSLIRNCWWNIDEFATATTPSTYRQIWDGNTWIPGTLEWGVNNWNTCDFDCNYGYVRDNTTNKCIISNNITYQNVNLRLNTRWLCSAIDETIQKQYAAKFCNFKWHPYDTLTVTYTCIEMYWSNLYNRVASDYLSNTDYLKRFLTSANDSSFTVKNTHWNSYYPTLTSITCEF